MHKLWSALLLSLFSTVACAADEPTGVDAVIRGIFEPVANTIVPIVFAPLRVRQFCLLWRVVGGRIADLYPVFWIYPIS